MISTTLTIDDDGILTIPEEILNHLGWKQNDVLEWVDHEDGSFELKKVDESH